MNTLVPVSVSQFYNDNDGAYDIVQYFNRENGELTSEKLLVGDINSPEVNHDLVRECEREIKHSVITRILSDTRIYSLQHHQPGGIYNINCLVVNSRKYKGVAELITTELNYFKGTTTQVAVIKTPEGDYHKVSRNCINLSETDMYELLNRFELRDLFVFKTDNSNKFRF